MKEFSLSIYTPEKMIFKDNVVSLRVPAEEGDLGVLAHHAPLIAALKAGRIMVRSNKDGVISFISKETGFIEVENNKAVILVTSAARV